MNIFGSILTTFESSSIFRGSWGSIENWLNPKTKPPSGNLACPKKSVKQSVVPKQPQKNDECFKSGQKRLKK